VQVLRYFAVWPPRKGRDHVRVHQFQVGEEHGDVFALIVAFDRAAGNRGANTPSVDGRTVALVGERIGVPGSWMTCVPS
jgi:hypothetical protein